MELVLVRSAFQGKVERWSVQHIGETCRSMEDFLEDLREQIQEILRKNVEKNKVVRFQFYIESQYTKDGDVSKLNFKTKSIILTVESSIANEIESGFNKLLTERGECEAKNSGQCFEKVVKFEMRINK